MLLQRSEALRLSLEIESVDGPLFHGKSFLGPYERRLRNSSSPIPVPSHNDAV